jgi:hypothetical protein
MPINRRQQIERARERPRCHVTDESLHQKQLVFSLVMLKASIKHQSPQVLWSATTGTI